MEDPGGGGGPTVSFGSRYNGLLDWNDQGTERSLSGQRQKQKKRTAYRDTRSEVMYLKQSKMEAQPNGPRYLILKRTDPGETIKNVSPFYIKKAMDSITTNVTISRTKDGELLLKTTNKQQAEKLLKQSKLGDQIRINVEEHPTLNQTKGIISCFDLKMLSEEEILEGLRDEHVVDVKQIKRRNNNNTLEGTSSYILTFNLNQLPESTNVGFYPCKVKQYIPSPFRCMNCLKFGHRKDQCKSNQVCARCANLFHEGDCSNKTTCVNCRQEHHTLSKQCPVYYDEIEIQRIKVTEKLSIREARQKRRLQTPNPIPPRINLSYAETVRGSNPLQGGNDNQTIYNNQHQQKAPIVNQRQHQPTDSKRKLEQNGVVPIIEKYIDTADHTDKEGRLQQNGDSMRPVHTETELSSTEDHRTYYEENQTIEGSTNTTNTNELIKQNQNIIPANTNTQYSTDLNMISQAVKDSIFVHDNRVSDEEIL
ncbi:uncharacterized protein LOC131679362 [Topomyia yanbarensis]|uniref:uncharacterized protein LOC131679362 n=1 Tax=Topomyia yanbarensis TaxID=2498891 RepID=UPI00273BCD50|nr:uncharacterized protein LOC131679362 [Topomyia yanbarensis]